MKIATKVVRVLLGIMMLTFGLNGFLQFMPTPEVSGEMGQFLGAIAATGYMFPMISLVEAVSGVLLLTNKFVPLVLIVLFTVLLNAFLAHLFLDMASIGAAALATAINLFLLFAYKEKYLMLITSAKNTST